MQSRITQNERRAAYRDRRAATIAKRVLDEAAHALNTKGPSAYWEALSGVSDYAQLAGEVVDNDGLWGQIANHHLLVTARKFGTYQLVVQNLEAIRFEIAAADYAARHHNLAMGRPIQLTSQQVEKYHHDVFTGRYGLPETAFTGTAIKSIVGECWSAITDSRLTDANMCYATVAMGKVGALYFKWRLGQDRESFSYEEIAFLEDHEHLLRFMRDRGHPIIGEIQTFAIQFILWFDDGLEDAVRFYVESIKDAVGLK